MVGGAEPPRGEQPRAPSPSPSIPTTFGLDVSALVASGPVASTEGMVTRVGGAAALAYRRGLRPSLLLSGLYAFPFSAGNDLVASQVKLSSSRLVGTLQPSRWSWGALDVGAGGGVDVLSVEPASKLLPAAALGPASTYVDPVVSGMITLRVSIAPNVVLSLSALLDPGHARARPRQPLRASEFVLALDGATDVGGGVFVHGPR